MKLIAALLTRNELGRYLRITVPELLAWVDEIRVRDDGSDDGTLEYLEGFDRVEVLRCEKTWAEHEGRAQAELFEWVLEGKPSHVLTIDADEVVPEGEAVRSCLEVDIKFFEPPPIAYTLKMVELWGLYPPVIRVDGGWRPHPKPVLYRVPEEVLSSSRPAGWHLTGKPLGSPRVPDAVLAEHRRRRSIEIDLEIVHLGWANPRERERRHRRYQELDGGRYHAKAHLDSILWPDDRCDLRPYDHPLPAALEALCPYCAPDERCSFHL